MTTPTNASGEPSGAQPLVIEHSPATPSPVAGSLSAMECASPLALSKTVTVCAGCAKQSIAPGIWVTNDIPVPVPDGTPSRRPISHGLCPDCCQTYAMSRPVPDNLRNARILRTMIQGNLDMAARLIQIGDGGMALAELTQAMAKIDQTLNALAQ